MNDTPGTNSPVDRIGLCATCVHCAVVEGGKGKQYYLCGLSKTDKSFPKYPPLPVLACDGFASSRKSVNENGS